MAYELVDWLIKPEETIDEHTYKVGINIVIKTSDNVVEFTRDIEVISFNSQTGYEVDQQREQAVTNYINQLNDTSDASGQYERV